jgi:hypothetical protein
MEQQRAHRRRIEWTASSVHPKWMIASPTLSALRSLLGDPRSVPAVPASTEDRRPQTLSVRLEEVPGLAEVGGVAKVVADSGAAVGVARVGRTTFVGFRLDGEDLQEIEVALDESAGRLLIASTATYPAPPRS